MKILSIIWQKIKKIDLNIALFLVIIFSFSILNLANTVLGKEESVLKDENRRVSPFPRISTSSLQTGDFTKEIENYYNDRFVFRNTFIDLKNKIETFKGIQPEDQVQLVSVENNEQAEQATETTEKDLSIKAGSAKNQKDESNKAVTKDTKTTKPSETGKMVNNYLVLGNRAIELHQYNESLYVKYAKALNNLKKYFPKSVKMHLLLAPTAYEFLKEEKYYKMGDPEKLGIDKVKSLLSKDIDFVNVYDVLKANSDKNIYFRTDHHWTSFGAYLGYASFMKSTGQKAIPLKKYKKRVLNNYLGTLYGATKSDKLKKSPEQIEYYIPYLNYKFWAYIDGKKESRQILDFQAAKSYDKYCLFLGGLRSRAEISTGVKNGKSLLLLKDSYANSFIPFLLPHYEKIYIIDPRACTVNVKDFISQNKIDEVIFVNYVFSVTKFGFPDLLSKLK